MKIFKFLSIILLFTVGLFFTSCEKEWSSDDQKTETEVSFGITNPLQLKSDGADIECTGLEPTSALIVIDGVEYNPVVFYLNGNLYTEVIKLASGEHTVESFTLLNGTEIISATPAEDSDYAIYVNQTVPFDFTTTVFDKTEVGVEVLCFTPAQFTNFGFNWFNIGQIEVFEIPFFGDICHDGVFGQFYSQYFDIEDYPFDVPALFEITVIANGDQLKTFSNVPFVNEPVRVEWFTHSNMLVEFQLLLSVYDVETGLLELVDTIEFDSENPLVPLTNNVVDFVIGDCWYGGTAPQLQY